MQKPQEKTIDKPITPRGFNFVSLPVSPTLWFGRAAPLRDFFPRAMMDSETAIHVPRTSFHMLR
nr:hypothetical protein [Burkholderia territorii]